MAYTVVNIKMMPFNRTTNIKATIIRISYCPVNFPLLSNTGISRSKAVPGGMRVLSDATDALAIKGTALAPLTGTNDCGLKNTNDGFSSNS